MTKLSLSVIQIKSWKLRKLIYFFPLRKIHFITSNVQISHKKMVHCYLFNTFTRPKNRNFAMRLTASIPICKT